MKRFVVLFAVVLLTASVASAQPAMQGSKHDLGTGGGATDAATNVDEICVFCHTPHQAAAASAQDPLWNHTLSSTASYGVYGSDTLNASPNDLGGASAGSAAVSNLCLSCHDGTIGLGSLYNDPAAVPDNSATTLTGAANVGTDLTNDHPVNFAYDTTLFNNDGGLVDPASLSAAVPLFGGTLQCASCHDPHDETNTPFLVVSNVDSGLCAECHTK
jgi:predicted CXXCH cytochrome family protein